jgi:hypothetical protein
MTDTGMKVHHYFKNTKIAEWEIGGFLVASGLTNELFFGDLTTIHRSKRLPPSLSSFAWALLKFYQGTFGEEKVEIDRSQAHRKLKKTLLGNKGYLVTQQDVESELDAEISGSKHGMPIL